MIGGRPVTRRRPSPGGFDYETGDPVGSTTSEQVIDGCAWAPRTGDESHEQGRNGVVVGLTLYLPAGSDITERDSFTIDGQTWQVEGIPGVWTSPFSPIADGVEVALRRAEG